MNQETEFKNDHFKNLLAVLTWLRKKGWKISRAGIYQHRAAGKIKQQEDGTYLVKDVDKYARTFLKRKATGKRIQEEQDELQRKKTQLEVEKLALEVARSEHRKKIEEGSYISMDQFGIEMASRAAVLDAGLSHLFQSKAGSWVNLVGGDQRKLHELIAALMTAKDNLLNEYARPREWEVEFGEETGQD